MDCRYALAGLAFSVQLLAVSPVQAEDFPQRKAGLWELTTTIVMQGGMQQKVPGAKQCIDATTDAEMMNAAQGSVGAACSKRETTHSGNTYTTDSVCTVSGSTITSHIVTSGDYNSAYQVDSKSQMNPPLMGQKESTVHVDAKYAGACAPDQKPGDIILPTGMKMNLSDIKKMAAGMAQNAGGAKGPALPAK